MVGGRCVWCTALMALMTSCRRSSGRYSWISSEVRVARRPARCPVQRSVFGRAQCGLLDRAKRGEGVEEGERKKIEDGMAMVERVLKGHGSGRWMLAWLLGVRTCTFCGGRPGATAPENRSVRAAVADDSQALAPALALVGDLFFPLDGSLPATSV